MGLAIQEMGPEDTQERTHNVVEKPSFFAQRSQLLYQGGSRKVRANCYPKVQARSD